MLQLLSLAHGFAAPQPFSGPFWNLASQATGPWDQYWYAARRSGLRALRAQAFRAPCAQAN